MDRMYARILPALAIALLLFAGENRMLFAQGITIAPGPADKQQPQTNPCRPSSNSFAASCRTAARRCRPQASAKHRPKELCSRVSSYAASESKMLNLFTTKAQTCGIPPDAAQGLKSMAKTADLRTRICSAANNPGPGPQSPSAGLSGVLNQNAGAVPEAPTGGGIFDTLSGNVLQQ